MGPLPRASGNTSACPVGGSFTAVTVTSTMAVAVPPLPSETVYVNVTSPYVGVLPRHGFVWMTALEQPPVKPYPGQFITSTVRVTGTAALFPGSVSV